MIPNPWPVQILNWRLYRKLLIFVVVGLWLCITAGCSRFYYCCPPTNTLLSQAEAEWLSGVKLKLGYEVLESDKSSCAYVNGRSNEDLYKVDLDIGRFEEGGGPANELAHRQVREKYDMKLESIDGVGDSAFISQDGDGLCLYARQGTFNVQLWARSVHPPHEARERLISLARLIMARLDNDGA